MSDRLLCARKVVRRRNLASARSGKNNELLFPCQVPEDRPGLLPDHAADLVEELAGRWGVRGTFLDRVRGA
jgi:hypothetical protein